MVKERTIGGGKSDKLKHIVVELHHVVGMIWNLWKGIAIGSHLELVPQQSKHHKRRNIRLFVGIVGNREETMKKS
ncbi:MAG: hypothetical protein LBC11_03270 [Puniceicoccales bacterium]|jgi:hypothetical protein|nr:hypothetical protein [Puniceicoccales bacterium]